MKTILVIMVIAIVAMMALPIPTVGQANPTPTCTPQDDGLCYSSISSTLTPFVPTSTPVPPPTDTPTIIIVPLPDCIPISIRPHCVRLPIIRN